LFFVIRFGLSAPLLKIFCRRETFCRKVFQDALLLLGALAKKIFHAIVYNS
jgi:hypothetical protein